MKHTLKTFPNGLRALSVKDKDSLSATILILVNTGSRFENDDEAGIAHFVEHTIFKGTEKRPDVYKIGMEVESLGAKMNAFTSYDYTGYYIKCPKEKFEEAFEILSDMFLNSLFRQKDIDKEKGVILEELRMYEDQPMDKVYSVFGQLLFGEHPLGRDILGTEKTVSNLAQSAFKEFISKYYNAKNTVISVAGGVEEKKVFDLVEKYFGKFDTGIANEVVQKFVPDGIQRQKISNVKKEISQSHLLLGAFVPGRVETEKKYRIKLANTILGRGFSSRLFQEIRERQGLAYYVYSDVTRFEEIGDIKIAMGVENSKAQSAVDGVLKQLEVMKKGTFSDEEIVRAKNYSIGSLSLDLESTNQVALWYGSQLLLENKIEEVAQVKDLIQNVNKDTIVSICNEVLNVESLYLAGVTPYEKLKIDF